MIHIEDGEIFGNLTYIREADRRILPSGQKVRMIRCKCICGKTINVFLVHLIRGRTKSCGCWKSNSKYIHTKLHGSWRSMKNRAKENYHEKKYYADKGITLFSGWEKFDSFVEWALNNGYRPGLTIDRIDGSRGYFPENCRWVTQNENCNNRYNTFIVNYKGKEISFMILLREKNMLKHFSSIRMRIKRGWNVEKAIDTPIKKGNYKNKGYKYKWTNPK